MIAREVSLRRLAVPALALTGLYLFASEYLFLSRLSRWYGTTRIPISAGTGADYDLTSLVWQPVHPHLFEMQQGELVIVTSAAPYAYEALANIRVMGARSAGIVFDAVVERGSVTIGLQQAGQWITENSSEGIGPFADVNSTVLGLRRSLTVAIANRNPAGESRVKIRSLRLYLRK